MGRSPAMPGSERRSALGRDWPVGISTASMKRRHKTPTNVACRMAPGKPKCPATAGDAISAGRDGRKEGDAWRVDDAEAGDKRLWN